MRDAICTTNCRPTSRAREHTEWTTKGAHRGACHGTSKRMAGNIGNDVHVLTGDLRGLIAEVFEESPASRFATQIIAEPRELAVLLRREAGIALLERLILQLPLLRLLAPVGE